MLSVRASPSPSGFVFDCRLNGGAIGRKDEGPNYDCLRKRYFDGSHKGPGLGLGFDTTTCVAPACHNNRSNGGLEHQRPRGAYGKDGSRVAQFQSEANRNLGSHYPPQQACPIMPFQMPFVVTRISVPSSTSSVDSQSLMPVPSVDSRPHVNMHNSSPPAPTVHSTLSMQQNQRNQGPFIVKQAMPLLPPGPPPYPQDILPVQNPYPVASSNQPGISAYSGLITSLLAQGLISVTNQTPPQVSLGVEFKAYPLKVRHESVITALYGDLPGQCTTCGRRFKCQEEHKALCTNAAPKFMSAETTVEKKNSDEEVAIPAEEDQTSCVLCRECFDDFYSHEREEWMYKDAVYLNAPEGSTEGMDRSKLGPIVHAKCRQEDTEKNLIRQEEPSSSSGGCYLTNELHNLDLGYLGLLLQYRYVLSGHGNGQSWFLFPATRVFLTGVPVQSHPECIKLPD
ncbi:hypothetical protein ACFX13_029073 [Malus domestica]